MADDHARERSAQPVCRWRTSAETVDVIEALERVESILLRLDSRLRAVEAGVGTGPRDMLETGGPRAQGDTGT